MKLSIIILSFNTKKLTKKCLASIFKYPPRFQFEVLVVDNASKDDSPEMIRNNFPQVKLIINKKNLGYAKANNQAAKIAKGQYILLLNSDVEIKKGTIKSLINHLDTHSDVGATTAKLLNPDGSIQYYYHRRFPSFLSFNSSILEHYFKINTSLAKNYLMLDEKFDKEIEIEQAATTALAIRKDLLKNIGRLFDNHFPLFFNDTDLCLRINKAGFKIMLLPQAKIIHFRGRSTDLLDPYVLREELFLSMLYYFRKHKQILDYLLTKITLLIFLIFVLSVSSIGILKSYLGTAIKDRRVSLQKQTQIINSVIFEKPKVSIFKR